MGFVQYISILRIKDWAHLLGLTILGYIYASGGSIDFIPLSQGILIGALYLAYGYSLNEYFDRYTTNPLFLPGIALLFAILLAYSLHWQTALIVIFGAIAGFIYSARPFRAKEKRLWGLFCNAFCFAPLFLIGYSTIKNLDLEAILMAVFIWLIFLPIDLIHQLNDYSQDKEDKIKTCAVSLGIKKTIFLAVMALLFTLLWAFFLSRCSKITSLFFFITLFFLSGVLFYLLYRFVKYGNDINGYKIKLRLRYLLIAYGVSLVIIFSHAI